MQPEQGIRYTQPEYTQPKQGIRYMQLEQGIRYYACSTPDTPEADARYNHFRIINQFDHDEAKLRAAWIQAKEDEGQATALLRDPNFAAPRPVSVVKPKPKPMNDIGRVKEVDEATKAEKARVKEMGKKSAIYSISTLPPITPPVSRINGDKVHTPTTFGEFVPTPVVPQLVPSVSLV